jgi:ElaB/YqjD/DUF883 family membrane-anchored ribosome-binding protein
MTDQANPVIVEAERWFGPESRAAMNERATHVAAQVRTFVVEHPIAAVGSAMTFGFLVARIFRR